MKKITAVLVGLFVLGTSAFSAELNYRWKSGASYFFSATVSDNVNTSMMGMNMKETFTTNTDFVLRILRVDQNGTGTGILYLTKFSIRDTKGTSLASLDDIPAEAIQSDVSVDKKGKFTFLKKVYLITSGTTNVLAYGKADANSVSVGGQAGDVKVDAYAEFDPKTGKLKTGYNVQQIKNTTSVQVKVTEQTDKIDVFPYSFLEMLALPDGDVSLNDEVTTTAGMYKMKVKVTSMSNGIAALKHTMATDKSADMFDGGASGTKGDGSESFDMGVDNDMESGSSDMNMDMNSMGTDMDMDMNMNMGMDPDHDMGMDSEDKAAMDISKGMAPDMSCDVISQFDYSNGMFKVVSGTVTTNINSMGMKMNVVSKLEMKLIK